MKTLRVGMRVRILWASDDLIAIQSAVAIPVAQVAA
jgi:hypothetical protein